MKEPLETLKASVESVAAVVKKIQEKPTADDEQKSAAAVTKAEAQLARIRNALADDYKQAFAEKESALDKAVYVPVALGAVIWAIMSGLIFLLTRGIMAPLGSLERAMERLPSHLKCNTGIIRSCDGNTI
ncbi:hypothetical protein MTBLM1_110022 [Rhodospirillaceae bacterium LM-1]|nr:hypothetical protein MTBLM1_110022 [Rhodospirillaceae bacterium LM-1]